MDFIATLPGWVLSAAIGAVAGAIAGLIGWGLSRRGVTWGRFLPIVAVVLTVAAMNVGLGAWIKRSTVTPEYAAEQLIAVNPRLYGLMQEAFPDDFALLAGKVAELVKSDSSTSQLGPMAAEAMAEVRRKYAPLIGQAPDADHAKIIDTSIAFYEALAAYDPALCNQVAMSGPTALIDRPGTETLVAMIEPQAVVLLQAAANAMSDPVRRRSVTDADWEEVGNALVQQGASDSEIDAISNNDASSPDLCSGLIKLMRAMNMVDTEGMKAVRADFIKEVSAG